MKRNRTINSNNTIITILALLIVFGFILTPLTGDIKVFLGGSNQARYISSNLIIGSFKQWELKGAFNRLLFYVIYTIIDIFDIQKSYLYEVLVKFIYLIFVLIILYYSFKLIKLNLTQSIIIIIMLFANHTANHLQAEMTCTILLLLAYALYCNAIINNNIKKIIYSSIIIGSLFFFKTPAILLSVSIVFSIIIFLGNNCLKINIKRVTNVAFISFIFIVIVMIIINKINPLEIENILNASKYQNTILSNDFNIFHSLVRFFEFLIYYIWGNPQLIIGIICLVLNIISFIKKREYLYILIHIMLWVPSVIYVIISNCFFMYHYYYFTFPSIIELLFALKSENIKKMYYPLLLIVFIFCILFSPISINFYHAINNSVFSYKANNNIIINENEEVLFLDDGLGSYYLKNKSYLPYYYPLPVQRLIYDESFKLDDECIDKIIKYHGDYIVINEKWLYSNKENLAIKEKIDKEYSYFNKLSSYTPSWSLIYEDSFSDIIILNKK